MYNKYSNNKEITNITYFKFIVEKLFICELPFYKKGEQ